MFLMTCQHFGIFTDEKALSDLIKVTVKDVVVRSNQLEKKLVSLRGLRSLKVCGVKGATELHLAL